MAYPATENDTVLYTPENLYADKNVSLTLLDGSILEIWGAVYVNGSILGEGGASYPIATQPEAEAGVDNTKVMTSLRVAQAIDAQLPPSSQAEAEAGIENTKYMTALRVKQAIVALAPGSAIISVNGETGVVVLNQDEVLDGATYKQYSGTEKTKLSGIAAGATANSSDAILLARANHTGSQAISTVTGLQAALDAKAADAAVVHNAGNETIAGTKTFSSDPIIPDEAYSSSWNGVLEPATKNALYDKIETISGGAGLTQEQVEDMVGNLVNAGSHSNIMVNYDDTAGSLSFTVVGVPNNSVATGDIIDNNVTNAKLVDMAANTFKANNTASTADPTDINGTQATAMLDVFSTALKGLAPSSGGGSTNYLRADGTWSAPPGGGGSGAFYQFTYSNVTTEPPSSSQLRFNSTTMASVTKIWIMYSTTDSIDVKTRLLIGAVPNVKVYVQDKDNSAQYQVFLITSAAIDKTTYAEIPVSFSSGGSALTSGQICLAGFIHPTAPATETAVGGVELATAAETVTGTDNTRATHPAGVKAVADLKANLTGATFSGDVLVPDEAYSSAWDSSLEVPTKNALYDKIEALIAGGGGLTQEQVEDIIGAMFAAGTQTDCTVSYNDASASLSVTVTGVPALAVATGDIQDDAVTNAKLANMAANTFKANNTGSTADPTDITVSDAKTLLALTKSDVGLGNVDNTSDTNKPVSTAQATADALNRKIAQTINAQTGTTYTLVLTDADKLVTLSNASAITLTVPTNASVAFPIGTNIDLAQLGAGQVTVSGTPTLRYTPTAKFRAQYSGATLIKLATDEWLLVGDLASS